MQRLTIENAFDYVGNLAVPKFEPIGPNGAQAVALMLDAGADRCVFEDVDLVGHQDTLFADAGRSLFRGCRISGSVDFVFGGGNALFEDCVLHSRYPSGQGPPGLRRRARARRWRSIRPDVPALPAQPRSADCRRQVALGRAWRPGRTFPDGKYGDPDAVGAAVFLSCWMDAHIDRQGLGRDGLHRARWQRA